MLLSEANSSEGLCKALNSHTSKSDRYYIEYVTTEMKSIKMKSIKISSAET